VSFDGLADCQGRKFMKEVMATEVQIKKDKLGEMIETTVE